MTREHRDIVRYNDRYARRLALQWSGVIALVSSLCYFVLFR